MNIMSRLIAQFLPMGADGKFSSTVLRARAPLYIAPNLVGTAAAAYLYVANTGLIRIVDATGIVLLGILALAALGATLFPSTGK